MSSLEQLESKLEEMLVKKAPFQIPENGRKWIAEYAWIFALLGVLVGVIAFLPLLTLVGIVSTLGVVTATGYHIMTIWMSLLVLVGYTAVLAISVPKLKQKLASGWYLTYYSTLFFAVYNTINWIRYPLVGLFGFIFNMAGVVASLYILFQVRSYFKKVDQRVSKQSSK